jgi:hypothetical protein
MATDRKHAKIEVMDDAGLPGGLVQCFVTDRIAVDGAPVGFMYREEPRFEDDSGWRFLAGDESEAYLEEAEHHGVCDVSDVAEHNPCILPYLGAPTGTELVRREGEDTFEILGSN